jgi:2-polyprenyl-3-methyl-5-hydroxy-6-metoxy-1,4-benzoquinol methylase
VLRVVPRAAQTVLDAGCGAGGNARVLAAQGKVVDGITLSAEEAAVVRPLMREVWIHNLEEGLPAGVQGRAYDCVICSHVLEHIVYPERLLAGIRACLEPGGALIVALPNLLYHYNRLALLRGRFEYTSEGIMDNTHVRWYTFRSAQQMLARNGFCVERAFVEARFPLPGLRRFLPPAVLGRLDGWAGRTWPGLCGFQMIFVCRK